LKVCQLCAVDFTLKNFLLPLIDVQIKNGDEVISICSGGEYVDDLQKSGYVIETLPITRGMNPIKHLYSIWMLYWFMRREKFDVVHVHTPVAALLGRIAAKLCGVPLIVYTAHGFYFHDDMPSTKRKFFVGLERVAGHFTDLLFTQSAEDAESAIKEGIVSENKVFAIGNGVDVTRFDPSNFLGNIQTRSELNIPENAFLVGMIGRQVKEKGIIDLLNAACMLAKKYNDIYFLIIGDKLDSDHAAGVESSIHQTRALLGDRLIITGMRSDIPELLSTMNLFTLPSWREGMPRTIIEAMMMGLPVIATNIRGSREEVVDGKTGILVPLHDPSELGNAIEKLYLDIKLSEKMGSEGRLRALDLYDEQQVIEKQLILIDRFWKDKNVERSPA